MSFKEKLILFVLALVNFTHILDFMVMMPLGNFLMPYFKINPQQFSLVVAAYSISAAISGFAAAFFVDRYDRKKILLIGYAGFVLGTLFCGLAPSYIVLLIARIIAGLFGGLIGAQVLSIVSDIFPYERRATAMGYLFSAISLASVLGVPVSLTIAGWVSWHTPFIAIAALGAIIVLPMIFKFLPNVNQHIDAGKKSNPLEAIQLVLNNKIQRIALLLSGGLMLGHFLAIPFVNPYMEFNVGFTDAQRNLIYMVGGAVTFFCSPLFGKLSDKYGKHYTFNRFAIASLIPIFLVTNMPPIKYYFVLIITGFWFGISSGRNIPAQAIISNVVEPKHRGSFMSFNGCIQQFYIGLASIIAGAIVDVDADHKIQHYPIVGYISIAVIILCIFVAERLRKKQPAF